VSSSPPQNAVRKLVVVDDERPFTDLLQDVLADVVTCPVVTFTSPLEALAMIRREPIGMLITDYHMPKMDGIQLVQMLDEIQPGVPAIIITGHNLTPHKERAQSIGALKAIIQKPFGLKELRETIARHWNAESGSVIKP
jgi:DNA-binding NtrC family response regulator